MKNFLTYKSWLAENKPAGAPEWKDSDAPDAEGRFRDLGIKDLAAWLIKTRGRDLKKISGSLTQQVVFNRKDDPEYAEKMEKVRKEVYKQLGREDLIEAVKDGIVTCDKCGWHWDIVTGGDDPYLCHKCDTDNHPLNEKFGDDYPKNKYIELNAKDAAEYADDVIKLINNAYADKGGNLKIKNANDIKNGDITYWVLKDIDSDPDADVVVGGYFTPAGIKMTVMGQDGSRESKKEAITKTIELMKTRGFYAEFDKDLAQKMGLPHIQVEKKVREVLTADQQKFMTWNNDGSYTRKIAGGFHEKVMVGMPR